MSLGFRDECKGNEKSEEEKEGIKVIVYVSSQSSSLLSSLFYLFSSHRIFFHFRIFIYAQVIVVLNIIKHFQLLSILYVDKRIDIY